MKIIDAFLDIVYPPRCIICDNPIRENGFCKECDGKLKIISEPTCIKCGLDMKHCECKHFVYHFDGIVSPYFNTGFAQNAVYNLKFYGKFNCVKTFAKQMSECAILKFGKENIDAVTFVPANKKSLRERGFNQSELFAEVIAKELKLPLVKDILIKKEKTSTQHKAGGVLNRFENARKSYRYSYKSKYKNYLLVDDIKTSGASLDECARLLKFAGAETVYCVTALITRKTDKEKPLK